ncbi:MAG TPA: hypothetical protein VNG33_02795, partial [Polyangiaceae bacterium]|nr:hypothetical protein [Polyangiaceae bacterium]
GASIGGASIGGASIGGTSIGGGGQGPGNTGMTGDCKEAPAACAPQCTQKIAGCLVDATGALPTASTALQATVTSVAALSLAPDAVPCRYFGQSFSEGTQVSLQDQDGKSWSLLFPTETIGLARFANSTQLQVDYKFDQFGPYQNRQLVVSDNAGVAVFVLDAANRDLTFPGLDLQVQSGEKACPPSLPDSSGCSSYVFHTLAKAGQETVDDPCGKSVGGFIVSSLSSGSGPAPTNCGAPAGSCDGTGRLLAAGVRAP